jgi:hypothetical protein
MGRAAGWAAASRRTAAAGTRPRPRAVRNLGLCIGVVSLSRVVWIDLRERL